MFQPVPGDDLFLVAENSCFRFGDLHLKPRHKIWHDILFEVAAAYPNLKLIASTLRTASTASRNAWGAIALYQDQIVHVPQQDIDILDRVGGGDSFASGLIYGIIAGKPFEWAVRCGVAHGALAMTTAGDTSMATLAEVERAMKGGSARIAR